jgi:hypothetical protein
MEGSGLSINMGLLDWIAKSVWVNDEWDDLNILRKGLTFFLIFDIFIFMPPWLP